jgi:hypothetical protein
MPLDDFELVMPNLSQDGAGTGAGPTGASGVTSVSAAGTGIAPGAGGSIPSYNGRKKRKGKLQVPQNSASKG